MTRSTLSVTAILIAIAAPAAVQAQTAPKAPAAKAQEPAPRAATAPQSAPSARPTFHVEGFRSARFGMTQDLVKTAIAKDFNIPPTAIAASQNPIDGTSALSIKVDHLDPGPGAAGISYIFGARTKTLIHINLGWATGATPTVDDRKGVVTAALRLAV